jgi:hypothetical protein
MSLAEAFALFRRLGVNVETMNPRDFSTSYFALAKRYHPDRNPHGADLMASINAARAAILNCYRKSASWRPIEGGHPAISHMESTLEQMARSLVESGDYRVTSRLEPQAEYPLPDNSPKLVAAVVVSTPERKCISGPG